MKNTYYYRPSLTNGELVKTLEDLEDDEGKEIITRNLEKLKRIRKEFYSSIEEFINLIEGCSENREEQELFEWFWKKVLAIYCCGEISYIEQNITRLIRLNSLLKNPKVKNCKSKVFENEIRQAKKVSLLDIVSERQRVKRSGNKYATNCPFHKDKHPSFFIYPETNSFYCFGCGVGGDVIKFVELLFNYSFKEAVKWLGGER